MRTKLLRTVYIHQHIGNGVTFISCKDVEGGEFKGHGKTSVVDGGEGSVGD